jgi:hypothetical protein
LDGSIAGISLGLVGAQVFMTIEADGQASRFPSFHIDWVALTAIILLAVIAAWTAAAVPARAAARLDIVGALRGASRPPRPTRRRPVVGVALLLIGLVIALAGGLVIVTANLHGYNQTMSSIGIALLVTGPVTMQIGAALIAPLILRWSALLFSRFGASARLGARDAARNPSRSVPVLSAIMSTVFVASFVIAILGGTQASAIATHIYTTPQNSVTVSLYGYSDAGKNILEPVGSEVITAVNRAFGGTTARILSSAPDPDGGQAAGPGPFAVPRTHGAVPVYLQSFTASYGDKIWVGSATDLAAVLGEAATPQALNAYENGGVVSFYPQLVQNGRVTIDWSKDAASRKITRSSSLPAVLQQPKHEYDFGLFLSPQTAASIGLKYEPSTVFDQLRFAPTSAQEDALSESLTGIGTSVLEANWETGPTYFAQAWGWALVLLTALIALAAATIATALARADGRRDDTMLGAIGAAPGVRRAFGFWQAIILTGIGSIVGVVLGLVPALALSIRTGPHGAAQILPFAPSWVQLAITALAIPLLIAAGSWVTAGRSRASYNARAPIG